ncbi:MAG: 50S ribosomal protein L21 [Patescibacteria group bacterium]|jgi:large subunit ribosomal protein L21
MTFAVISTGGKQYLVSKGTKVRIEKTEGKVGDVAHFDEVLLVSNETGKACSLGKPTISGARVSAKIIKQERFAKVMIVKYKNKVRYRRTRGHRQHFTEIEITSIQTKKG